MIWLSDDLIILNLIFGSRIFEFPDFHHP